MFGSTSSRLCGGVASASGKRARTTCAGLQQLPQRPATPLSCRRALATSVSRASYHPPSSEPFATPPTPAASGTAASGSSAAPPPIAPRRRGKVTLAVLQRLHAAKEPITMLTAYDYPTALLLGSHPAVDMVLVGDSLAQVALGRPTTTSLTLDEMRHHATAVAAALAPHAAGPLLVVDLPFGSYEVSVAQGVGSAITLVKAAGADMVKIEGGAELIPLVRRLAEVGIPCMPHIGLTPQRAAALSGFKVQGRTVRGALALVGLARELEEAGASALLLEGIPSSLGAHITEAVGIPTIGIGAGPGTSGQVLVLSDALGLFPRPDDRSADQAAPHQPKFVRRFAEAGRMMREGIDEYVRAVKEGSFPHPEREGYKMAKGEWEAFAAATSPVQPSGESIP